MAPLQTELTTESNILKLHASLSCRSSDTILVTDYLLIYNKGKPFWPRSRPPVVRAKIDGRYNFAFQMSYLLTK